MTHNHDYVPVGVTWAEYWIENKQKRRPKHVVLACKCGAVRLVKAKMQEEFL